MKEYLFIVQDIGNETCKFIKVTAENDEIAESKFTKACCPFADFSFRDIKEMFYNEDVNIYYSEFKDITVV